ncbi:hypothetical protein ACHAXT_010728 [Thalassiosira profunda]
MPLHAQPLADASDQTLALWVAAFASSHIGMSAIRSRLISSLGEALGTLNLVGNEAWRLPEWWPGDSAAGNRIFPDALTAGRQVYRALYTAVSFVTLGSAFGAYLHSSSLSGGSFVGDQSTFWLATAALSFGAAVASLFNASPLGLMPSFEGASTEGGETSGAARIAGLRRDDALKFTTRGLTRITRHPLILPVVPWGLATAHLAGGRPCDYILFGGLAVYAVAGCWAQDLRVQREEGSVGTVFQTEGPRAAEGRSGEKEQLRSFFEETSFVPFKAVIDGRQSLEVILTEVPWLQFVAGTTVGVLIEMRILQLLEDWSVHA